MCSCFRPIIDRSSLAEKTELRLGEISFDKWRHIEAMSCLNWRSRDVSGWWRWTMQMRWITDSKVIIKFLCLIYFLFSLCFGKCRSFARWILTHKAYYNGQLDSIICLTFEQCNMSMTSQLVAYVKGCTVICCVEYQLDLRNMWRILEHHVYSGC